jgi:DNA (cytosine-5)-methyltransferase 1
MNYTNNIIGSYDWLSRKRPPKNAGLESITLVDLFCGCGGFSLGAKEAAKINNMGLDIVLAIDSDDTALKVYKSNFKESNVVGEDICNVFTEKLRAPVSIAENRLKKELGQVNILIAGPPCQGHSNLNNKTRRSDPRNQLYLRAIRGIEVLQPHVAIIENVTAVKHDKSSVISQSLEFLSALGYRIETIEVNAHRLNVAQERKRHFLVAYNINTDSTLEDHIKSFDSKKNVLKDVIADLVDEPNNKSGIFYNPSLSVTINKERIKYLFDNNLYDLPNEMRPSCHREKQHSYISMYGRMRWDSPTQTITGGFGSIGQGRFIHPLRPRVITPHEAARIQGFPDYFDFTSVNYRGSLHKMIGNAVPPPVSTVMISFFMDSINKQIQ